MILNIGSQSVERKESKLLKDLREVNKLKRDSNKPVIVIEFSWQVLFVLLIALAFIFWGKELVTIGIFIFAALVIMSAARPVVSWLMRRKFSKGWAVTVTYMFAIVIFSALISAVIVPLINQVGTIRDTLPELVDRFVSDFDGISIGAFTIDSTTITNMTDDFLQNFSVTDSFASLAGTVGSVFSFSTMFLAAIVFSIYILLDHDNLLDLGLTRISSDDRRKRVKKLVVDLENKLGVWLLGQATVSAIAGIVMGIALSLFGVPFALPLAVFIALMDAIPSIGATIATIPVFIIALIANGPLTALLVVIIFIAYQQIENTFISPKIMGNAVGIKPVFILLIAVSFLILFGVWGALLAVPIVAIIQIFYEFYIDLQKLEAKGSI